MLLKRFLTPSTWLAALDEPPRAGLQTLHRETIVRADLDRAFAFFSDAANLERMTPRWLNFQISTPAPVVMAEGTLIDYRLTLYGVPIPWRTRIDVWEPGARFVDRQIAGPYLWWRHEHLFEPVDGGTRVIDLVAYAPRAAMLSQWLVRRDVGRIFAYRQHVLAQLLAGEPGHSAVRA